MAMVSETCMTVVKTALLFFGVVGSFGNVNIMIATYLHKALRSKCGLLLAVHAFSSLICLLFEVLSAIRLITNTAEMPRSSCFWSISVYLIFEIFQSYTLCAVGMDRMIAICFPIKYMICHANSYIFFLLAPGMTYALLVVTIGAVTLDDEIIPVCNPPLAYPALISTIWNQASIVICCFTVFCYVVTYLMLFKIAPRKTKDVSMIAQIKIQKIMVKTLIVNVCVFFFSAVLCALIIFVMRQIHVNEDVVAEAETYAVIPGLLSYSIDYYVYFWRSSEYRRAFKKQLFCGYRIPNKLASRTTVFVSRVEPLQSRHNSSSTHR